MSDIKPSPFLETDTKLGLELLHSPDDVAMKKLQEVPDDQLERLRVRAHAVSNRIFAEEGQRAAQTIFEQFNRGEPPQNAYVLKKYLPQLRSDRFVGLLQHEIQRRMEQAASTESKPE